MLHLRHLVVSWLCWISVVESVVIGIDLGSEAMKVALVKPGVPLEVVLNVQSKRKTPTTFAFHEEEVLIGDPALQLLGRFPRRVAARAQVLLGQPLSSPIAQDFLKNHPYYDLVEIPERNTVAYNLGENVTMTPEEVTAMLLRYAAKIAADFGEAPVHDAVITVPAFYTLHERAALVDAAELADLRVLTLINDYTAVALNYGISRNFNETEDDPRRVVFYDLGAGSLTVSLVEFSSKVIKSSASSNRNKTVGAMDVKAVAFDRTLGGHLFDIRLADIMASQFNENAKVKRKVTASLDDGRPMTRLRVYATRVKEVLSANKEIPTSVESLVDEVDYKGSVSREQFEAACEDLFARVLEPVKVVLAEAGREVADIDEVVLVGGGSRVPRIQQLLKEFFGREQLEKNVNADEAAVMGAAFYAATLSPSFRVKEFQVNDVSPFPIAVSFLADAETDGKNTTTKTVKLFKRFNDVPSKKAMTFTRNEDFTIDVVYQDVANVSNLYPSEHALHIRTFNITGVKEAVEKHGAELMEGEKPKIKVSFALSFGGQLELTKAQAYFNETVTTVKSAEVNLTDDKDKSWFDRAKDYVFGGNAEDGSAPKSDDDDSEGEKSAEQQGAPETDETESASGAKGAADEENPAAAGKDDVADTGDAVNETATAEAPQEPQNITVVEVKERKVPLGVSLGTGGFTVTYTADETRAGKAKIQTLADRDHVKKERAQTMNDLESHIYQTKDKLSDDEEFRAVSTEDMRESIGTALDAASEWLYDEGASATTEQYRKKLADLQEMSRDIIMRVEEARNRPQAVAYVADLIAKSRKMIAQWANETARALARAEEPRLTEEDLETVAGLVEDVHTWLTDKVAAQEKLEAHENPAFSVRALGRKFEPLERRMTFFKKKPKPPPRTHGYAPPLSPVPKDREDENDTPVFTSRAVVDAVANTTYTYYVETRDVDNDTVTINAELVPSWLTLFDHGNGSAVLNGTAEPGTHRVTLRVKDEAGLNDTQKFLLFVPKPYVPRNQTKEAKSSAKTDVNEDDDLRDDGKPASNATDADDDADANADADAKTQADDAEDVSSGTDSDTDRDSDNDDDASRKDADATNKGSKDTQKPADKQKAAKDAAKGAKDSGSAKTTKSAPKDAKKASPTKKPVTPTQKPTQTKESSSSSKGKEASKKPKPQKFTPPPPKSKATGKGKKSDDSEL